MVARAIRRGDGLERGAWRRFPWPPSGAVPASAYP